METLTHNGVPQGVSVDIDPGEQRYNNLRRRAIDELNISEGDVDNYLKPFSNNKTMTIESAKDANIKLVGDIALQKKRREKNLNNDASTGLSTKERILMERQNRIQPDMTIGQELGFTDVKADLVRTRQEGEERILNVLKGKEQLPSVEIPVFGNRTTNIPTQAKAFEQSTKTATNATQQAIENIKQQAVNQAKQELTEEATKKSSAMAKFGKVGKIAAGVGITAAVISNMNKSKGQQSNAELYGQRTPYGY